MTKKKIKFYDTSSLLLKADTLFDTQEEIWISSITLEELEQIKTSAHKDPDVKYSARKLVQALDKHIGEYNVKLFSNGMESPLLEQGLCINNDAKILACALSVQSMLVSDEELVFITNDICLKHLARLFIENVESENEDFEDDYTGYKDIIMTEEEMADFYSHLNYNKYNLKINEYILIKDSDSNLVDIRCWNGEEYRYIISKPIESKFFGKVSAFQGDIYQKLAIDSLYNNQLTVLRGPAGSGKSWLGLTYLFSLLEKHIIDKIYIFCNPVATKDAAKLGFYPGDRNTKLLDSQIGNFLLGKFEDISIIEGLINEGKIVLVPVADCRGMDISSNAGVYMTEAQNSTINTMKLILQRIGDSTVCVIEGDEKAQVDLNSYEGLNNGLSRLSKVFRNESYYGEVKLNKCYRSKIAEQAENM